LSLQITLNKHKKKHKRHNEYSTLTNLYLLQTTQEAVEVKQKTLDTLMETRLHLIKDYQLATLPLPLQTQVDKLTEDWRIVKDMAAKLEPTPLDSSIHEVFTQGTVVM